MVNSVQLDGIKSKSKIKSKIKSKASTNRTGNGFRMRWKAKKKLVRLDER